MHGHTIIERFHQISSLRETAQPLHILTLQPAPDLECVSLFMSVFHRDFEKLPRYTSCTNQSLLLCQLAKDLLKECYQKKKKSALREGVILLKSKFSSSFNIVCCAMRKYRCVFIKQSCHVIGLNFRSKTIGLFTNQVLNVGVLLVIFRIYYKWSSIDNVDYHKNYFPLIYPFL